MTNGPRAALLAAVAFGVGASSGPVSAPEPVAVQPLAPPRADARLMISGHSLTDEPFPTYLAAIAGSLSTPLLWNQQSLFGSSLRQRTRGEPGAPDWSGYRRGRNRDGDRLDIAAELRRPATLDGRPYDALLVTEQHTLLGNIVWNDSVRYLRHIHDRLIEGNRAATTYLYESWMDVSDMDDPRRWIAYELAAAPVWRCVATRINLSLAGEGRADRIEPLPAASALASLVAQATGRGVPGISARTTRETMARLFRDSVHLTPLGTYHVALVAYATIYRRSPVGAWAPAGVTPAAAAALQRAAWRFVEDQRRHGRAMPLGACRRYLARSFVGTYLAYQQETHWKGGNALLNAAQRLRFEAAWRWRFARDDAANPFHYDPARDRAYWFPA